MTNRFIEKTKLALLKKVSTTKIYRRWKGKVWVCYKGAGWIQTEWVNRENGYLRNKFDGGQFHKSFNLIIEIEDYVPK